MNNSLIKEIKEVVGQVYHSVILQRRYLHRFPELSSKEFNTRIYIQKRLEELKIRFQPIAGTGIVGVITGALP